MKKNFGEIILFAIMLLALVFALGEAWNRHRVESSNRQTEILVEYGELREQVCRRGAGCFTMTDALQALRESGVGGVLFKEQSLDDLARQGELQVFSGAQLLAASRSGGLSGSLSGFAGLEPFNPYHLYLEIPDAVLWERVAFHLENKIPGTVLLRSPGACETEAGKTSPGICTGILSLPLEEEKLAETGAGFPEPAVETVSSMGLNIYLQIYGWSGNEENIPAVFADFGKLPGVRGILFQNPELPGFPYQRALLASELGRLDVPLVAIDLFEQQRGGLLSLIRSSSKKEVIRLHAISQEERDLLSGERALGRYLLAVSERNIRLLLVRYDNSLSGEPWLEENVRFIAGLKERLAEAGHPVGTVVPYKSSSFLFSRWKILLISAGILAGGALLLQRLGMTRAGLLLGAAGLLLVGFLLTAQGNFLGMSGIDLARKGMALVSGITFPLLGIAFYRDHFGKRSLGKALSALAGISLVSLTGAFLAVGLLADMTYIVKLDQLQGIRLALLLPLPLAGLLLIVGEETSLRGMARKIEDLFNRPLVAGSVVLAVLLLIAAVVALSRSGNESFFVTELELRLRFFLDQLLTVRPRTKEFFIGHPLLLAALYWGFRNRRGLVISMLGMVGQVSLVNTFYHLHTPLAVSLLRTAGGLVLGIILGVVLIAGVKLLTGSRVSPGTGSRKR